MENIRVLWIMAIQENEFEGFIINQFELYLRRKEN
jgi:hypothetical protein